MQDPAPQKEELLATTQACELQELLAVAGSKLHRNQQCALAAKRANNSLGCVNRLKLINSRLKEVINTLYSALIRLHPEYCIQLGTPQYKKTTDKTEELQQRPPKRWGLEHLSCGERLGELSLFSLGERWLWGNLPAAPQCCSSACGEASEQHTETGSLWLLHSIRTRDDRHNSK